MSLAVPSHGTLLQIGDGGSPEVFTTIAEVLDITGPSIAVDTEDVTSHDSGGWREHIATLADAQEVEFSVNFIPGNTTHGPTGGIYEKLVNRAKANYRLVFPTVPAKQVTFAAYVTNFEIEAPVAGVLRANITLRAVGQPVWS